MKGAKIAVRRSERWKVGLGTGRPRRSMGPFCAPRPSSSRSRTPGRSSGTSSPSSVSTTYSYSWRWSLARRLRTFRLGMERLCRFAVRGPRVERRGLSAFPHDLAVLDDQRDVAAADVVGEIAPVGSLEEDDVGRVA